MHVSTKKSKWTRGSYKDRCPSRCRGQPLTKSHLNRTPNDARRVIRDYGLDKRVWDGGIGTAEGFANRLFAAGEEMTTGQLAAAFYTYLEACAERGTEEVDQEWEREANALQASLCSRAGERRQAADFIRNVKFKSPGGLCWQIVATLATTDDRLPLLAGLHAEAREELQVVLRGIEALEPFFQSWYALPYRPGRDWFVDDCLRQDIERFDITLETAEPWAGQDEDWFEEASALLRLVRVSEVHNELATFKKANAASVDEQAPDEVDA